MKPAEIPILGALRRDLHAQDVVLCRVCGAWVARPEGVEPGGLVVESPECVRRHR